MSYTRIQCASYIPDYPLFQIIYTRNVVDVVLFVSLVTSSSTSTWLVPAVYTILNCNIDIRPCI